MAAQSSYTTKSLPTSSIARTLASGLGASVLTGVALGKLINGPIHRPVKAFDKSLLGAARTNRRSPLDPPMSLLSGLGEPFVLYPVSGLLALKWLTGGQPEKSAALAVTLLGSAGINAAIKRTVERRRPVLELPFARTHASGSSFPSSHATMSLATYGVIAYLLSSSRKPAAASSGGSKVDGTEASTPSGAKADGESQELESSPGSQGSPDTQIAAKQNAVNLPVVGPRKRGVAGIGAPALLLCALIGWSRVYQGVHYPSDVVAGWTVGGIWLAVCCTAARLMVSG